MRNAQLIFGWKAAYFRSAENVAQARRAHYRRRHEAA
jgi:hypothetical protein